MAIFNHGNGVFKRYPPSPAKPSESKGYENDANWRPYGTRKGIEIHRDGKTMRNKAVTP